MLSTTTLRGILYFEWRYHTRRLTFLAASGFFLLMGFMLTAQAYSPPDVFVNSPYQLAYAMGLLSLTCVFPITLFCAQSVLRDQEYHMAEMVYSTAVTKLDYLLGRFGGVLLATTTSVSLALVGMWMGTYLVGHDRSQIGPFEALAYLGPFCLLIIPNMLFAGAVIFAVAVVSRSSLATYVGGVFLYLLYFLCSLFAGSPVMAKSAPVTPDRMALVAAADPFGLAAFFEQTHYWTVTEQNTQMLALEGHLLTNRLAWTGLALVLLVIVYRCFAFRLATGPAKKVGVGEEPTRASGVYRTARVDTEPAAAQIRALVSTTRLELRHALRSWPFVVLLVMWAFMVGIDLIEVFGRTDFGTRLLPTTGLLLGRIQEPLGLIGLLMLIFYSAELVWRDRVLGMDEIVDAAPASSLIFLLAKTVALTMLIAVLTTVAIVVAGSYQLASGQPVELGLYLAIFYFTGLPLVLVGVLALFIQTVSPNRYLGMLVSLLTMLLWHKGAFGGPIHPLLRYAKAPDVSYSAMSGFSPMAVSFTWFMVYWTAVAGLVILVTYGLWRRGTDPRLKQRLSGLTRAWGRGARLAFQACLVVLVGAGLSLFYQTNILNAYETTEEMNDWKAEYEKAYRHLENEGEPIVTHMEVQLDLYPDERRFDFRGRQRLVNRTEKPIKTVWVAVRRDVQLKKIELSGAGPEFHDKELQMFRFALPTPMAPGAEMDLTFELSADRRAVEASGVDHGVVENGSFLLSTFLMPTVGYRLGRELRGAAQRKKRGLAEYSRPTTIEGAQAAGVDRYSSARRTTFDATISTPADQIAVTSGELRKTWQQGDRAFFHYVADQPITPYFGLVSARYEVDRTRLGDIDVEIYYHGEHLHNIGRFRKATVESLEYCINEFGPYPHSQLRLVEIPAYWDWFRGLALPGIIYFVEDAGFLTNYTDSKNIDIVTKRVAHEVAHQWWGHQLSPAPRPGASVLVESLARYTELMILRKTHGASTLPPVLATEMDRYLRGRAQQAEVPLYQVGQESWLFYSKGALVMLALTDLIGEENVNRALHDLLAESVDPNDPPDSLDLLRHLYAATPEKHHGLLDEWWKQTVLYDLSVESASYEAMDDGRYRVTVEVSAAKEAVVDGEAKPLKMDEDLDIALFAEHPNSNSGFNSVFYERKHRIEGDTTLTFVVDQRPGYAMIDPFLRRIERNQMNNMSEVKESGKLNNSL